MPSSPSRCAQCGRAFRRSNPANARYWSLLNAISDAVRPNGEAFSPMAWHVWAKRRYLPSVDVRLPDGAVVSREPSTADLDTDSFGIYMQQVETWAAENGAWLDS